MMKSGKRDAPTSSRRYAPSGSADRTHPTKASCASLELAIYPTCSVRPSNASGSEAGKCGNFVTLNRCRHASAAIAVHTVHVSTGSAMRQARAAVD